MPRQDNRERSRAGAWEVQTACAAGGTASITSEVMVTCFVSTYARVDDRIRSQPGGDRAPILRAPVTRVANRTRHEPARTFRADQRLDPAPELPRDRACPPEPRDGAHARTGLRDAAPRSQRLPARRGVRADVPGDPAARASHGPRARCDRPPAALDGAEPHVRPEPSRRHPRGQPDRALAPGDVQ